MGRKFLLLVLILAVSLILRVALFKNSEKPLPENRKITLVTRLQTTPKVKGTTQSFQVHPSGFEAFWVTTPLSPRLYYGERLKITGSIKHTMLDDNRIASSMYFPNITISNEQGTMYLLRRHITSTFERYLPTDQAHLLLGIVFGIKEPLSSTFEAQVRDVGLLHVIAASGMNVTLLASAFVFLFGLFLPRKLTITFTLLAIFLYAAFAGFQASIVRASVMGSLALVASFLGRQYLGIWALGLTAYFMIVFSPLTITYIGFELSFLATLGIIVVKPLLPFPKKLSFIKEDITTTTSAQIMTLPILLSAFGSYNVVSIVVNAAVLWTVAPLMILGGIAAVLSFIFEPLSGLTLYLSIPLLSVFQSLTAFFAQFSLKIQFSSFSFLAMLGYFFVVGAVIIFLKRKEKKARD